MNDTSPSLTTDPRLLRINPEDNVAVATTTLETGESVTIDGRPVTLPDRVPTGHKLALVPIAVGEKVIKYGSPIGSATCDVHPGDYIHTHNLRSDYLPTYTLDGSNPYLREDGV
ncbi:MAG: UxaA family hydrolase [Planctomycetota bacterium]|jgi:altronate dehydratase